MSPLPDAFRHCREIVERSDPDRAVSLAFAPADRRDGLAALYAFDIETARIRAFVSQPLPGEIRLQWWRDVIARPGEEGQGSPVAQALLVTIDRHALPADAFERFLEARIFDLYDDPMPTRDEFEAYAGETASTLMLMASMVLGGAEAARTLAEPAGHGGVALLATELLRREGQQRAMRQAFFPGDILAAAGADHAAWAAGGSEVAGARLAVAAYASDHLARVEKALPAIARSIRPAFLPALGCRIFIDRVMRGNGRTPEDASLGPLRRSWVYWRAMRA